MTIVLVHGAWGGAWCWKDVAASLRARGFEVYAPTLTGVAERSHVAPGSVTLSSHVADIAGLMRYEELGNVLLVGHSYGGMVITGAADREPARIAGMVYLDAFVPESGQALLELVPPEMAALQRAGAQAFDGGQSTPIPERLAGEEKRALFTPQPMGTLEEKFVSTRDPVTWPRRHYILCTAPPVGFARFGEKVRNGAGWEYSEFDAGHSVVRTHPALVAGRLAEIAKGWGIAG